MAKIITPGPKARRRVGVFSITFDVLDQQDTAPLFALMKDLVVMDLEVSYMKQRIKYTAISPHFREVAQGEMAPVYNAEVRRIEDKQGETHYMVTWQETDIPYDRI